MGINIKKILVRALLDLSAKKPLSKITIADIIEEAGTARQTFYNHFKDKNDLIYYIYLSTLKGEKKIIKEEGYYAYLVSLHFEAQKIGPFLKQACKMKGQNTLTDLLYDQNYNYYKQFIVENFGKDILDEEMEYALEFNASGATHVFIQWILKGAPGTAENQAKMTLQCMPEELRAYLPLENYREDKPA